MERVTSPGITFAAPGLTRSRPTVPTWRPGRARTMRSTASTSSEAASSAFRRWFMGVVPAWLAKPVMVTSQERIPTIPSTTPIFIPVRSRIPPCSMWSST